MTNGLVSVDAGQSIILGEDRPLKEALVRKYRRIPVEDLLGSILPREPDGSSNGQK